MILKQGYRTIMYIEEDLSGWCLVTCMSFACVSAPNQMPLFSHVTSQTECKTGALAQSNGTLGHVTSKTERKTSTMTATTYLGPKCGR